MKNNQVADICYVHGNLYQEGQPQYMVVGLFFGKVIIGSIYPRGLSCTTPSLYLFKDDASLKLSGRILTFTIETLHKVVGSKGGFFCALVFNGIKFIAS